MNVAHTPNQNSVATEAADWYARLRAPDVSEIEAVRFRAWLAGDPACRREFDAIDAFWEDLAAIERSPEIVRVRKAIATRRRRKKVWSGYLATAAALLIAVGVVLAAWHPWSVERYVTGIGEQRMVPLADGSVVTLNTATEIRLRYSRARRVIELVHGQANFDVAKDPDRPFVVTAGGGLVRAVGTVFDVYDSADKVTVTLIEGKLIVTPKQPSLLEQFGKASSAKPAGPSEFVLRAGEQLSFAANDNAVKLGSADIARVIAWRARKLEFSDTPVLEAIAEANRYSRDQIVLDAPELAGARISGTFDAGKNEAFVEGLQTYFHLDVERATDHRLILTQKPR